MDTFLADFRKESVLKKQEKHRHHSWEFKQLAVMLANHPNIQTQDVATTLGIHPFMLSRWKKESREGKIKLAKSTTAPPVSDLTQTWKRIRELERENAQLREENDLLKKLEPSGSRTKRPSSRSSRSTEGGSK